MAKNLKRRTFGFITEKLASSITLLLYFFASHLPVAKAGDVPAISLRGYGSVAAHFSAGRGEFDCDSDAHALILQGKLLADLLWDAPASARTGTTVVVDGVQAIVHEFPPYGVIAVGRVETKLIAVGATSVDQLQGKLAGDSFFHNPRCKFAPEISYPAYLDFFDLQSVKIYQHAFTSLGGLGLDTHWPFLKKLGLGISFNLGGGMLTGKSPAPGVLAMADIDYEVREAEKNHGLIAPTLSVGGLMPLWAANEFPDSVLRVSPTALDDQFTFRESTGMPLAQREATGLWSMREMLRRYRDSTAVGGWQFYDGPGGIEATQAYQLYADFSPAGLADYRDFLKNKKKLDLAALGQREFGDAKHYSSWDEVFPLDSFTYFGKLDDACQLLSSWHWQPATADAEPPALSSGTWRSVTFPGKFPDTGEMFKVTGDDAFYRTEFDASSWLAKTGGDQYLVCGKITQRGGLALHAWLNGHDLGEPAKTGITSGFHTSAVKINGMLKPGKNELAMWVPRGKLLSPFFLTPHKPEDYPSSDRLLNARYIDLRDWQFDRLGRRQIDAFTAARQVEPDRPMTVAPGGAWELCGAEAEIAARLGASLQNTGREAFYQPWWARLGRVAGFYGSSEPSGTTHDVPNAAGGLDRLFGWVLFDGDSSHILFHSIEEYIDEDRKSGWLSKNKRLMQLVGKYLAESPQVIVFRSSRSMQYGSDHLSTALWSWDLGRGELNAAHINWGYASEREVALGLPPTCKVLLDAGSEIVDDETTAGIEKFVRAGGTFIALHNTGENEPLAANTWPIATLLGCDVQAQPAGGTIKLAADASIFKASAGREFLEDAKGETLHLKPKSGDVSVIATWSDGSAAVTSRALGKGRVICLGSTFWRNAHDVGGVWITNHEKLILLQQLMSDLGVTSNSDASSDDCWIGNYTSKNGLEDWVIAFNTANRENKTDIKFRSAQRPAEVRDVKAMTTIPFVYSDGWVQIKDLPFRNQETRVFAIKRADMADGLPYWWQEKQTYWKTSGVAPEVVQPRDAGELGTLQFDHWKTAVDADQQITASNAWTLSDFADDSWSTETTSPHAEDSDYHATKMFRSTFTLPPEWKDRTIDFSLFSSLGPVIFGQPEFYINGKPFGAAEFKDYSKDKTLNIPITSLLQAGNNVLAIKLTGGSKWAGDIFSGFGGALYLSTLKPLNPDVDLSTAWSVASSDGTLTASPHAPLSGTGRYLECSTPISSDWVQKNVYLRLEFGTPWLRAMFINGHLMATPAFFTYGKSVEFNITPYIKSGETARIELWGRVLPLLEQTKPGAETATIAMDLLSAHIGCVR